MTVEHPVRIIAIGRGGTVEVDGRDISHLVTAARVTIGGQALPTVALDLVATAAQLDLQAAHVHVGASTRELLVQLGWTPPGVGAEQRP